uniref:Putative ovule protein n=1 Tax=Solanum chacoense TaxID=4108 RepID=A0A0V0H1K0_SOLCH
MLHDTNRFYNTTSTKVFSNILMIYYSTVIFKNTSTFVRFFIIQIIHIEMIKYKKSQLFSIQI